VLKHIAGDREAGVSLHCVECPIDDVFMFMKNVNHVILLCVEDLVVRSRLPR